MARVLGIGGVFFKCGDTEKLTAWYEKYLGMSVNESGGIEFPLELLPDTAYCVWGPFRKDTDYFAPSGREFMINLVVDDLEQALEQVVAGGAQQIGEIVRYEYGRFGWFLDPEGNKVELWEPRAA